MARKKQPEPYVAPEEIEIEHNGTSHTVRYRIKDGWIEVSSEFGTKSAALHASPAPTLARLLFLELLGAYEAREKRAAPNT